MWFLIVIILVNAWANQHGFVLEYRIDIGVPLNIYDILLAIGLVATLLRSRHGPNVFQADSPHPLYRWIIGFFVVATFGGLMGSFLNGTDFTPKVTTIRNLVALPISVMIGYGLTKNLKCSQRIVYAHLIAGVGVSILIILFFRSQAVEFKSDINQLRTISYISNYAGIAFGLLLITVILQVRLLPRQLAIAMAGICFIGQFATLSRSDWLATVAGTMPLFLLLPKGKRIRPFFTMVGSGIILVIIISVSLYFASRLTQVNFFDTMFNRVVSILPGVSSESDDEKAWDTRLSGAATELKLWSRSPLWGQGFGIHELQADKSGVYIKGFRHNTWTSTLAETGIIGFIAMLLVVGGTGVIGFRMARDRFDRPTFLIGVLGTVGGAHIAILGLATMSFNQMRGAIILGIMCGVVIRTREMQLTSMRQLYQYNLMQQQLLSNQASEENQEADIGEKPVVT